MNEDRGDELNEHHNDGEKDASDNKYNPPHSISPLDFVVYSDHETDRMIEDNEAYDKGYEHGRSQK